MEGHQTFGFCAGRALHRTQAKESQDQERRWASNDEQKLWLVDVHHQVEDLCGHTLYCLEMQASSFSHTKIVIVLCCFLPKMTASLLVLDCPNQDFLNGIGLTLCRLDASAGNGTKILTPIRPTLCLKQALDVNDSTVRLM